MGDDLVLYETDGDIGIVTMNRPEKLNVISHELRTAVSDPLIRADDDEAVNVVILGAAGLGILPPGRGMQSRPDPNHPSGVAPGKRPRLTPSLAILLSDDGLVMPFGAPGGDSQVLAMLQVVLNAFHFGMDIQEAIDAPRFMSMSFPNSFAPYNHYPGLLGLEDSFPLNTPKEHTSLGHKSEKFPVYSRRLASVEAVLYQPNTGFADRGLIRNNLPMPLRCSANSGRAKCPNG